MADGKKKAVVLLSGGLDSATVLAIARGQGFECHALSFDYGQRHSLELIAAARIANALGATGHNVVKLDLTAAGGFGGSALTDRIDVPKDRPDMKEIPVTYVPARNTIFLSVALGYAEVVGAFDIFIGVNAIDYSGYPDCRPEFIAAFEKMANLATAAAAQGKGSYTIHTPLIRMSKAQIITTGLKLAVPYELTLSCYDPGRQSQPCGHCDSCKLRLEGFLAAGAKDPLEYR